MLESAGPGKYVLVTRSIKIGIIKIQLATVSSFLNKFSDTWLIGLIRFKLNFTYLAAAAQSESKFRICGQVIALRPYVQWRRGGMAAGLHVFFVRPQALMQAFFPAGNFERTNFSS